MRKSKRHFGNTLPMTDSEQRHLETPRYTPSTEKSSYPQASKSKSLSGIIPTYAILESHEPSTLSLKLSTGKAYAHKSKNTPKNATNANDTKLSASQITASYRSYQHFATRNHLRKFNSTVRDLGQYTSKMHQ